MKMNIEDEDLKLAIYFLNLKLPGESPRLIISLAYDALVRFRKGYDPKRGNKSIYMKFMVFKEMTAYFRNKQVVKGPVEGDEIELASLEYLELPYSDSIIEEKERLSDEIVRYKILMNLMGETKLTELQRSVIKLRFWKKLRFRKIGEMLGISASRARTEKNRGIVKLRIKFKQEEIKNPFLKINN